MQTFEHEKPVIKVYPPCTCDAPRWFYCRCPGGMIASYQCHQAREDGGVLRQDADTVAAMHPGMDLIYFGDPLSSEEA